ncbi:putative DNA polymerase I alpha catalytic subunit [Trypanosoma rangeli]|uniref:DNA polymerase n=1 Tax=Trypanosoma rangeli TaxID=5698 RepID=A0A3R7MDF7_TRYRA|nr:putative DNA polymerase I alpha catalytic subunit [Trypanosoma rangeli]RNF03775.1 putative DNA polymerase I alpha catalytic subunit [Trypanosoma rangeli]|eukprot:RNF03775.1 putative DNA polymerase I alpha catalytic subunit [Trypanosoma rangeli]
MVSLFSETEEEQWQRLKEEAMIESGEDDDSIMDGGTLTLPQETRKRKTRKTVKSAGVSKTAQAQQQKLTQSISAPDMEKLLKRYRGFATDEEDGVGIDITKFLQDDALESEAEEDNVTAGDLMSSLLTTKNTAPQKTVEATPNFPLVSLNDEIYVYDKQPDSRKVAIKKKLHEDRNETNYVVNDAFSKDLKVVTELPTAAPSTLKQTPDKVSEGGTSSGLFYWFDAKEQPHTSSEPGTIILFGKLYEKKGAEVKFRSCCVRVKNIFRCTFLHPREGSSDADVIKEINSVCQTHGIGERRVRFVERYYAFDEPGIRREKNRWAKLRFPGKYPCFPAKGEFKHIQAVMGASRSLLELFLIKKKLMGPLYLHMKNLLVATDRVSHCDVEYVVDSPKNIEVDDTPRPSPPFTLASIQLHTQLDIKGVTNEVVAVSIAVYCGVNIDGGMKPEVSECFTGVRQLSSDAALPLNLEAYCHSKGLPGVRSFGSERALLTWVASTLGNLDPDIVVGHNFIGYTIEILLNRYHELNIPQWSTIGRLDIRRFPRSQYGNVNLANEKEACIGRLVVDTYLLSREYYKSTNYKLASLTTQMGVSGITDGRGSFEPGSTVLDKGIMASSKDMFHILLQLLNYAVLSVRVAAFLDVIPLTKRLTTLAGNLWSRTLYGSRSERIEYLLLHAFHNLKFVTPDKKRFDGKRGRHDMDDETKRKTKYQGGMVLEPKTGLYSDYILLLDFNSLYPSLIQEFNICYTTIERGENTVSVEIPPPESLICSFCAAAGLPSPCLHRCILPKVIRGLVESRREIKRLMKTEKDPSNLATLEIRQKALKLTANSMYGCLGFEHSRFYAQPLAELVTRQGRIALQNTVELIPQISPSLRVIYGDTDSVMIQTGIKDNIRNVRELGFEIKNKVNQRYQSLELDIDGVFRAMLLLKKKKYAALSVVDWQGEGTTYKKEIKGLDMVRRDWCPLSQKVSEAVLSRVLNANAGEDILDYVMTHMKTVADDVRAGNCYALEEFVISKSLTKEPESYRGTAFPHAAVALRMKQRKENVRVGDLIPYVICEGEHLNDKAYHVDEVRRSKGLRIDLEWYLSSQLYPPVMRLCEHIQGFSPEQLCEVMGVACHVRTEREIQETFTVDDFSHCSLFKSRELSECFPTAVPLQVQCTRCHQVVPIDPHKYICGMVHDSKKPLPSTPFALYACVNCGQPLSLAYLANCLTQMCHNTIQQFYISGGNAAAVRAVRTQFTYFRALFDVPHAPGCSPVIKDIHCNLALRCLGTDQQLYTLSSAASASDVEPVDHLFFCADSFYRRIDHLLVNIDNLFASM